MAPSTFSATPKMVMTSNMDAGNIMDNKPMVNIPPFGACMSLANPQVAAATAAALGVLTPVPCMPVIPAPWVPGAPTVLVANMTGAEQQLQADVRLGGSDLDHGPGSVHTLHPLSGPAVPVPIAAVCPGASRTANVDLFRPSPGDGPPRPVYRRPSFCARH